MKNLVLFERPPGLGGARVPPIVADAVVFPDGMSVLHWRTRNRGAVEIYATETAMRTAREHARRVHFEEA